MLGIKMQGNYKIFSPQRHREHKGNKRKILRRNVERGKNNFFVSSFLLSFLCALCVFVVNQVFCSFSFAAEAYESFSPQQIMTLSKENPSEYIFLDVNEEGSISKIPNSVIIPLEKIVTQDFSPDLDFNKTIIVYCEKGIRSLEASKKLSALGAKKVINMEGGIEAWEKAGGKVEKKTVSTPFWPGGTCEIVLPK